MSETVKDGDELIKDLSDNRSNDSSEDIGEIVVDGKKLKEWFMSDEGMIDYDKSQFGRNVSNNGEWVIYDMGGYYHDPAVCITTYSNGVDMARLAGSKYNFEPYDNMSVITPFDGDDVFRIFLASFNDATIKDFILYYFKLIDGYTYISETSHHVYVKGRIGSDEERDLAYADLRQRYRE